MTLHPPAGWSPADNPYAIAVSEAQWWRWTVHLSAFRLRDADDPRTGFFSSRQIDARQLVVALRQILYAERLQQAALKALGMDPVVGEQLAEERKRFEGALPGVKDMRDALVHFAEWSQGEGLGPQKTRRTAGDAVREIAREHWGFEYDPVAGVITQGPNSISVDVADRAAAQLAQAIYMAARQVDLRAAARLRLRTIEAIRAAGIDVDAQNSAVRVSPGYDLHVWLSLTTIPGAPEHASEKLAERIVLALTKENIGLICQAEPQTTDFARRLARGEVLHVEPTTLNSYTQQEAASPSG